MEQADRDQRPRRDRGPIQPDGSARLTVIATLPGGCPSKGWVGLVPPAAHDASAR
jgi:hypothetical protein